MKQFGWDSGEDWGVMGMREPLSVLKLYRDEKIKNVTEYPGRLNKSRQNRVAASRNRFAMFQDEGQRTF